MPLGTHLLRTTTGLAFAALAACGPADTLDASTHQRVEGARRDATAALEATEDLAERLDDVRRSLRKAEGDRRSLERGLDAVDTRLRSSLEDLRAAISEVRSDSASVMEDVDSALAGIDSASRDLSVLTHRFDYHLRRYHRSR